MEGRWGLATIVHCELPLTKAWGGVEERGGEVERQGRGRRVEGGGGEVERCGGKGWEVMEGGGEGGAVLVQGVRQAR